MDIAAALRQLRPLLTEPEANLGAITELLLRHQRQAEGEVLKACASPALRPVVDRMLKSRRHTDRVRAVRLVKVLFDRSEAARVLRKTANDVHLQVRRTSAFVARRMALPDVALPFWSHVDGAMMPEMSRKWAFWGWFFGSLWHATTADGKAARGERSMVPRGIVFPPTKGELLAGLNIDGAGALRALLRAGAGRGAPYVIFKVPKARGGERELCAPRPALKAIQRRILQQFLATQPVHEACHGFVRGRSIVSNAAPHAGAALVLKTDIADFFPSIHYRRIAGLFALLGARKEVAEALAGLTTYRPLLDDGKAAWPSVLPQGAPTSPMIANLICRRLDARLAGLATRMEATYTRYADDLTFSFRREPDNLGRVFWWINAILQQEGFSERVDKRKILRPARRQQVTGVVVNRSPHVPRDERRRFKAILANCERHGVASQARGRADFEAYLLGYAAYVKMVQPELGEAWLRRVRALLGKEAP